MSVYTKGMQWNPPSNGKPGFNEPYERRETALEVHNRFLGFVDDPGPRGPEEVLHQFMSLVKERQPRYEKDVFLAWQAAVKHFATVKEPKFVLDFDVLGRVAAYTALFDQILAASPSAVLTDAAARCKARVAQLEAEALQRREAARQEYNHLLQCTGSPHYGKKLRLLLEGGWVTLGAPQHGDSYMSKTEKQSYRARKQSIFQADFGVSRPIQGTIPDEYPASQRLALHEHCTYTGEIQVASIQKEAEAGLDGIAKRWLEPDALPFFKSAAITRSKLLGNG
jgi:hypothetical protein